MRSLSFVVAIFFTFVALSHAWPEFHVLEARKGHKNNATTNADSKSNHTRHGNSVDKACHQMDKLVKLSELAANQTKLDALVAKGKLNTTEVDDIKAKAAEASTKLQTMQSNTTLVQECAVVDAHQKVVRQCRSMKKLQKLSDLASNKTAMDAFVAKKKLNDTQVTKLQERIANATTKLQTMQGNTTLTALCSAEKQQKANGGSGSSSSANTSGQATAATASKGSAAALSIRTMPLIAAIAFVFTLL